MGNGLILLHNYNLKPLRKMKKQHFYMLMIIIISFSLSSCGISKEIRAASIKLVQKQQTSLTAHESFHKAVITTLVRYLDFGLKKSKIDYDSTINDYDKGLLDFIKKMDSTTSFSVLEKKIKVEKLRQKINVLKVNAFENHLKRIEKITLAKKNLLEASTNLLASEKAKSAAIKKINEYLQAKRPSERLLELINVDLEKYTKYVTDANKKIEQAKDFINHLNIKP